MNRTPTILSGLALLGVIVLFILHFSSGHQKTSSGSSSNVSGPRENIRIAYVDIDSFEAHYESLKAKKSEFKAQQESMENELQRSAQQMQSDYADLQRKSRAGTLSQAEGEAAQRRLSQMQESLETRRQSMSAQFQEKLETFNKDLHKQMDEFLADYTKDKHFDYVLSFTDSNPLILYADKSLNITEDVIKGMNAKAGKVSSKDTAKGK